MKNAIVAMASTILLVACGERGTAQQPARAVADSTKAPTAEQPRTKLEGFKPAAGSILTLGYDVLGTVSGVSIQARTVSDASKNSARGLVVEVTQSEYRNERAFVDADEVPELLRAIDALLDVKANPTSFKNFEVRYDTRGGLQVTAFNSNDGAIMFAVQAGQGSTAQKFLSIDQMRKFKDFVVGAAAKLGS